MAVDWGYYDKFETLIDKYMQMKGEGETKASQIVTAVNKLVYKWYNDGDVFDNSYYLEGWLNDLSDYANWLDKCTDLKASATLKKIKDCYVDSDYEDLLKELADKLLDEKYLEAQNNIKKIGTIYNCEGQYKYVELNEDDEDYYE